MRLLFAALAAHGHTYPLIPLAIAAREAGHDVVFATGEAFVPGLRKAGLDAVPGAIAIRDAFGEVAGTRSPFDLSEEEREKLISKVFGDVIPRRAYATFGPLMEAGRPDLVVCEMGNFGVALAAHEAGLPTLTHGFGRVSPGPLQDDILSASGELSAELGIEPVVDKFIDICPESVQEPGFLAERERIPLRPVSWNEPGELPAGVLGRDRGRPLGYLTLGTAFGTPDVLRAAIAGLGRLPVDLIVAAGPTVGVETLGEVPANVHLEPWVPQGDLLPHLDFVVHHGGSGTTLGAMGAGLPQLIVPQGADQFTNAEAVLEAGVGSRLLPAEFTADAVYEKVRSLLADETIGAAARRLGEEVAGMPSPADVVARLEAEV